MSKENKVSLGGSVTAKNGGFYPIIYVDGKHQWGKKYESEKLAYQKGIKETWMQYFSGEFERRREEKELKKKGLESDTFWAVYENWNKLVAPELYYSEGQRRTVKGNMNKHVLPVLADKPINKITTNEIRQLFYYMRVDKWVNNPDKAGEKIKVKEMPAPATKKKVFAPINSVFDYAVQEGLVESNPCYGIKLKGPKQGTIDVWSADDLMYFFSLQEVRTHTCNLAWTLLATTGARRSEICGLSWADFQGDSFHISEGLDAYLQPTTLKTDGSRRTLYLLDFVIDRVLEQKEMQGRIGRTIEKAAQICKYVITDEFNQVINPKKITNSFREMIHWNNKVNSRKLPEIPLKNLRHSYATMLINENEGRIKAVSEILGHSKTSTTERFYYASSGALHRGAVDKLNDTLKGLGNKKSLDNSLEGKKIEAIGGTR